MKKEQKNHLYKTGTSDLHLVEETVSPFYQRGGLAHAIALLGLSEPDSLLDAPSEMGLVTMIRNGLNKKVLDTMMAHLDISAVDMGRILHTSDRTMRRYTDDTVLNPDQSEKLLELARLFAHGIDVFGSSTRLRRWMNGPVSSLGGKRPIDLLDTTVGITLVNDTIGKIEYGIAS
jgi:putative toxin-antitoxin system antitoxin component (TIGR02293 family)